MAVQEEQTEHNAVDLYTPLEDARACLHSAVDIIETLYRTGGEALRRQMRLSIPPSTISSFKLAAHNADIAICLAEGDTPTPEAVALGEYLKGVVDCMLAHEADLEIGPNDTLIMNTEVSMGAPVKEGQQP